jgi:integrase/recombinase XerD
LEIAWKFFLKNNMIPTAYLVLPTKHKKKNGKYPVKVRVVYQRASKDFRTGIDLTEDDFNNAYITKPKSQFKELSIKLSVIQNRAHKIIEETGIFTFQKFEDAFYMRLKDASNIFPVFEEYIQLINQDGRIKTGDAYDAAMKSIKNFRSKIGFYDITPEFLKKYQKWMVEEKGNRETTVGIYLRTLRAVYNYGISKGLIRKDENYPFANRKYVIPAGRNIKKALAKEEIAALYSYETFPGTAVDKAKDFWFLSYFANGINFKDIVFLKNKNIDSDKLNFVREKTRNATRGDQVQISCHLSEPLLQIIEKWRTNNKNPDAFLFDILDEDDNARTQIDKVALFIRRTNDQMKNICKQLGINKNVTTYYSRHTAASMMKKSGHSVEEIREALGHKNTITTQKYLDSFDDATKRDLAKALTQFI